MACTTVKEKQMQKTNLSETARGIILGYAQHLGVLGKWSKQENDCDAVLVQRVRGIKDKHHHSLMMEMVALTEVIHGLSDIEQEEGVPAEMLGLFEEKQWPALIVEFQPSMRIVELKFNTMEQHKNLAETGRGVMVEASPGHWLLYNKEGSLMIRQLRALDSQIITTLKGSADMSKVATEAAIHHDILKTKVIEWMNEALIIDIGVPIPENAEFVE